MRRWLWRHHQRGAALIETAIVLPVLLTLVFGIVGVGRIVQARIGVSGVAREAARAAALADTASQASSQGLARAHEVASGYRLTNGTLQVAVDPGAFQRGGQVRSDAQYEVALDDLPLLHWVKVKVEAHDVERIDLYRSRRSVEPQP